MTTPKLHAVEVGSGPVVVLLHGMIGSSRYWERLSQRLAKHYHVIAVDLLGFGRSPKPRSATYTMEEHINSILNALLERDITQPVTIIGHSVGALIGLALAARHPAKVNRLVLTGMPVYQNEAEARQYIEDSSKLPKQLLYGPLAQITCAIFCNGLRPFSQHVMPFYLKHLPKEVARDSLRHTYRSYFQTLSNVLHKQDVAGDLAKVKVPVILLYGDQDKLLNQANIKQLGDKPSVTVKQLNGSHHLPLEMPEAVEQAITQPELVK